MIHVIARSEETWNKFFSYHYALRSELVPEIHKRSITDLLNTIIKNCQDDSVCIVHDDVYLCSDFDKKINSLTKILNTEWPNWGIAGNTGVTPIKVGYAGTEIIRYMATPFGGPNFAGKIFPATSIDGNVMLLNIKALRDKSVTLPIHDKFQVCDIVLGIETLKADLGIFVAPQLACFNGNKNKQQEFSEASESKTLKTYISSTIKNRIFVTPSGTLTLPINTKETFKDHIIDIELKSLLSCCKNRAKKKVAIITRTQFSRPKLLDRCLRTISSFISFAGDSTDFKSYIVTDKDYEPEPFDHKTTLLRTVLKDINDSRFHLVKFAAETIEADFFWFIDDDDWLFPTEAKKLSLIINSAPSDAIIFVDCQKFKEKPFNTANTDDVDGFISTKHSYFKADEFIYSLSGINRTPFCGAIFSRNALLSINKEIYDTVTYYEDYTSLINSLLKYESIPLILGNLYVGISLRESGNTMTETDRSKWDKSMGEIVSYLVNGNMSTSLLSLASYDIQQNTINEFELLEAKRKINNMIESKSWQLTRPLRGIDKLIRGKVGLQEFISRSLSLLGLK